jgi:hypothetical protein
LSRYGHQLAAHPWQITIFRSPWDNGISHRELPSFLEPTGVYLEFNPAAFRRAYQVFAKEVEFCANSHYLWMNDDLQPSQSEHYSTSPYWTSFRQFVANTRQTLAEQPLPPAKRVAHQLARHVLKWLES